MTNKYIMFKSIAFCNFTDVLFIDPGLEGTGWSHFSKVVRNDEFPTKLSRPKIESGVIRGKLKTSWEQKASQISRDFYEEVISKRRTLSCVIEFPEYWGDATSHASTASGDLFHLTYLVGRLAQLCEERTGSLPILITPREWKGQLKKDTVIKRFRRYFPKFESDRDKKIRDHEGDTLGMGLAAMGLL